MCYCTKLTYIQDLRNKYAQLPQPPTPFTLLNTNKTSFEILGKWNTLFGEEKLFNIKLSTHQYGKTCAIGRENCIPNVLSENYMLQSSLKEQHCLVIPPVPS